MNNSNHKGLAGGKLAPYQVMAREPKATEVMNRYMHTSLPPDEFAKKKEKAIAKAKKYLYTFVNVTEVPATIFSKGSTRTKVGTELFRVVGVKPPTGNDFDKDPYLLLEDMTGDPIDGRFKTGEVRVIDKYV